MTTFVRVSRLEVAMLATNLPQKSVSSDRRRAMNNAYAHLKLHNLKMEKLERMEIDCRPVRLERGGFHRLVHRLSGSTCACHTSNTPR